MNKIKAIITGIILLVVITLIVFIWGAGGSQATIGIGGRISESFSDVFGGYQFRALFDQIRNPFAIPITGGEYEQTPDRPIRPDQAFSLSVRGTESIILDQSNLIIFISVNNLGSTTIEKIDVTLDLASPFKGCVSFPGGNTKEVTEIPPGSSKEVMFSQGRLDMNCMLTESNRKNFEANTRIGGVSIVASATTIYPAASRLAVERIEQTYGELLIRNNVLRQERTGAIYRAGSAMIIDMDAGRQPIFAPSEGGLLIRWSNVGSGEIIGKPSFFVMTPSEFGKCEAKGGGIEPVKCNNEFLGDNIIIEEIDNIVENFAPHMEEIINWVYEEARDDKNNVCLVKGDVSEFDLITCTINIPEVTIEEKRITDYITTIALYEYRQSSRMELNAWCILGGNCVE